MTSDTGTLGPRSQSTCPIGPTRTSRTTGTPPSVAWTRSAALPAATLGGWVRQTTSCCLQMPLSSPDRRAAEPDPVHAPPQGALPGPSWPATQPASPFSTTSTGLSPPPPPPALVPENPAAMARPISASVVTPGWGPPVTALHGSAVATTPRTQVLLPRSYTVLCTALVHCLTALSLCAPLLPCVFTAFAAKTPPLHCVFTASVSKTLRLPCGFTGRPRTIERPLRWRAFWMRPGRGMVGLLNSGTALHVRLRGSMPDQECPPGRKT